MSRMKVRADELQQGDKLIGKLLEPTVRAAFPSEDVEDRIEVWVSHGANRRFKSSTLIDIEREGGAMIDHQHLIYEYNDDHREYPVREDTVYRGVYWPVREER